MGHPYTAQQNNIYQDIEDGVNKSPEYSVRLMIGLLVTAPFLTLLRTFSMAIFEFLFYSYYFPHRRVFSVRHRTGIIIDVIE